MAKSDSGDIDGVAFEERIGPVKIPESLRRVDPEVAAPVQERLPETPSSGELGYEPALDGLRAYALIAVLFFHARFGFAVGGFLGVSVFFTLSGFLITTLLVAERTKTGTISLKRFWSRRFRRLLPASWLCLGVVLAMGSLGVWDNAQLRQLRGDGASALLQIVNWHFIVGDRSYGDAFAAPSPLEHYWSLAVEEQFYLIFPLLAVGLIALTHGRARLLGVVAALGIAVSSGIHLLLGDSTTDRLYFGTDTRLSELLLGVVLATVMAGRLRQGPKWMAQLIAVLALGALGFQLWMFHTASTADGWLYPWGLLATAVSSVLLVLGAIYPGPLRRLLSVAPLVRLGTISYGMYLFHWPVFLWLTPARTELDQWPLFALRIAVTLIAAIASFVLVEQPIRRGTWPNGLGRIVVAPLAVMTLIAGIAMTTDNVEPESALEAAEATNTGQAIVATPQPQRILVVGDQLGASLVAGFAPVVESQTAEVRFVVTPDCGMAVSGYVKLPDGTLERDRDRCGSKLEEQLKVEAELRPDIVLVWSGVRDAADRWLGPETTWSSVGESTISDFLQGEYNAHAKAFAEGGAHVVWMTAPYLRNATQPSPLPEPSAALSDQEVLVERGGTETIPPPGFSENDPNRIDALNAVIRRLTDVGVTTLDTASYMSDWPEGQLDPAMRPDGVTLTPEASEGLVEWILESVGQLERRTTATTAELPSDPIVTVPQAPVFSARRTVEQGGTVRALVVGDSVGFNVGLGLSLVAKSRADIVAVNAGQFGCPLARGGNYRFLTEVSTFQDRCNWSEMYNDFLKTDPDVVVMVSGVWDVVDRILPGDFEWRSLGDPLFDSYFLSEAVSGIDLLASQGATVMVLSYPHLEAGSDQGYQGLPESDPARVDRLNELLLEAVSLRPGVAKFADFQGWLNTLPGGELDPAIRKDGLHFWDDFAPQIGEWLTPQVVATATTAADPPG